MEFWVKSTNFIPQTATSTPFRPQMPAILHFAMLYFRPAKDEFSIKKMISLTEFKSFKKEVVSSA